LIWFSLEVRMQCTTADVVDWTPHLGLQQNVDRVLSTTSLDHYDTTRFTSGTKSIALIRSWIAHLKASAQSFRIGKSTSPPTDEGWNASPSYYENSFFNPWTSLMKQFWKIILNKKIIKWKIQQNSFRGRFVLF
jgi:hypothetical protein